MLKKFKGLTNNLGYSMMEAVAVLGVSSIAVLGLVEVSHQMARATRSMQVASEIQSLWDDTESVLRNADTCSVSLNGLTMANNNVIQLLDPANPGNTFLTSVASDAGVGKCYPSDAACDFRVTDIRVLNESAPIGARNLIRANIRVSIEKQGNVFGGSQTPPRWFTVFYNENAGQVSSCAGSTSMQDVCRGLCGGDTCWDPNVNGGTCNIVNFSQQQCDAIGGTYSAATGYCQVNPMGGKNECEALFGKTPSHWVEGSGQCVLNVPTGNINGYKDGCSKMNGVWCDESVAGGKCASIPVTNGTCILYTVADSCVSFGGTMRTEPGTGAQQCVFVQDNQELCNSMGGDWDNTRSVKCALPLDGVKVCSQLGGVWTGTYCKLYNGGPMPTPLANPSPAIFPVPTVIPPVPTPNPGSTPLPTPTPVVPSPGPKYYWRRTSTSTVDLPCAVSAVNPTNCSLYPAGVLCSSNGADYTCTQDVRFTIGANGEPIATYKCIGVKCE